MKDFKIFVMKCPEVIFTRKTKRTFQIFVSHLYLDVADSSLILLIHRIEKLLAMIITVVILHRVCIRSLDFAQSFVFSAAMTGFGISCHLTGYETEIINLKSPCSNFHMVKRFYWLQLKLWPLVSKTVTLTGSRLAKNQKTSFIKFFV